MAEDTDRQSCVGARWLADEMSGRNTDVLQEREVGEVNTFDAKYPGRCADCGDDIDEGDEIGYIDDEICCGDCVLAEMDRQGLL